MLKLLRITGIVAVATMLTAFSARASLVINGGFEDDFDNWSQVVSGNQSITSDATEGTQAALLGPGNSKIEQIISGIIAGHTYELTFDAKKSGAPGNINVALGSAAAGINGMNIDTSYAPFSLSLVALVSGNVALSLHWTDGGSGDGTSGFIDNVSLEDVTPVPEPASIIAGGLLLLPFTVSTLRLIRRRRTA